MSDSVHTQLAAYVRGRLSPEESASFAEHLATCERCRADEADLRAVSTLLQDTAPCAPPAHVEARTLAAVAALDERRADPAAAAPPASGARAATPDELAPRRRTRRPVGIVATVGAVAAGLAVAFVVGAGTAKERTTTVAETRTVVDGSLPGEQEKTAELMGDGFSAAARVNAIGEGRLVEVKSDTVPIIPKGTYYELWFVGPGDTPRTPNRISAGTWHPDERGRTDVRFLIAADPELFPDIEVTEEPPDGDPAPSRRVVLTSD